MGNRPAYFVFKSWPDRCEGADGPGTLALDSLGLLIFQDHTQRLMRNIASAPFSSTVPRVSSF